MIARNGAKARGGTPMSTSRVRRQVSDPLHAPTNPKPAGDAMGLQGASGGRWDGIVRPYSVEDVDRLRGSVRVEHTLARIGAQRLWELLTTQDYVAALGALTGNQA